MSQGVECYSCLPKTAWPPTYLDLGNISTKGFVNVLNTFDINKTLLVIDGENRNLELSARNVRDVKVLKSEGLNLFDVMKYQSVIFTQDAVKKVEGALLS